MGLQTGWDLGEARNKLGNRPQQEVRTNAIQTLRGQSSLAIIFQCLFDLLAGIHYERPVLHHRFTQRLAGYDNQAQALRARFDVDVIAIAQDSSVLM